MDWHAEKINQSINQPFRNMTSYQYLRLCYCYFDIYIYIYIYIYKVVLQARISLTLSLPLPLSLINLSSNLCSVSAHSWCRCVFAGRPTLTRPSVGTHWRMSFMSSSLLIYIYIYVCVCVCVCVCERERERERERESFIEFCSCISLKHPLVVFSPSSFETYLPFSLRGSLAPSVAYQMLGFPILYLGGLSAAYQIRLCSGGPFEPDSCWPLLQ